MLLQLAKLPTLAAVFVLSVDHANGTMQRAYALTNEKEYFAELTEAYYGFNDFYPFNREQLQAFDPAGYLLVEQAWGEGAQ